MQLKDIMTPGVEVIAPEASIYEAAETISVAERSFSLLYLSEML